MVARFPCPPDPLGQVLKTDILDRTGVSPHQFDRWCKWGLLPRGQQERRPGLQGSVSVYPLEVVAQTTELHRLFGLGYDSAVAAFELWFGGHNVSGEKVPALVNQELRGWFGQKRSQKEIIRVAHDMSRRRHPAARVMRNRLPGSGKERTEAFYSVIEQVESWCAGHTTQLIPPAWHEEDEVAFRDNMFRVLVPNYDSLKGDRNEAARAVNALAAVRRRFTLQQLMWARPLIRAMYKDVMLAWSAACERIQAGAPDDPFGLRPLLPLLDREGMPRFRDACKRLVTWLVLAGGMATDDCGIPLFPRWPSPKWPLVVSRSRPRSVGDPEVVYTYKDSQGSPCVRIGFFPNTHRARPQATLAV